MLTIFCYLFFTATSLTVPRPTNAAGVPLEGANISQEQFYAVLEQEMRKIEHFTRAKVRNSFFPTGTMAQLIVQNRSKKLEKFFQM